MNYIGRNIGIDNSNEKEYNRFQLYRIKNYHLLVNEDWVDQTSSIIFGITRRDQPEWRNTMKSLVKIISILLVVFGLHLILAHFLGYGYIDKIDSRLISSGFKLGSNLWLLSFLFIIIGLAVFIKYETSQEKRNKRHGSNNKSTNHSNVNYVQARNSRKKFSLKTIAHFIRKHKALLVTMLVVIAIIVILFKVRVSVGNALAYELLGGVILFFIVASVFVGSIRIVIVKILKGIWKS